MGIFINELIILPSSVFVLLMIIVTVIVFFVASKLSKFDLTLFKRTPPPESLDPIHLSYLRGFHKGAFQSAIFRLFKDNRIRFSKIGESLINVEEIPKKIIDEKRNNIANLNEENYILAIKSAEDAPKEDLNSPIILDENIENFSQPSESQKKLIIVENTLNRDSLEFVILEEAQLNNNRVIDLSIEYNYRVYLETNKIHKSLIERGFLRKSRFIVISWLIYLSLTFPVLWLGFYKINFESKSDNVEVENSTFKTYTIEEIKNSLRIDSEGYIKIFGSEYNLGKFINLPFFYQALQSLEGGFGLVLYILFLIFYFVIFIRGNMAFMLDHSSILGCRFLANAKKQFKWSKDLKPSDSATNIEYHVATYGIGAVESIGKYQYLCDFLDPTYSNESNQTPD